MRGILRPVASFFEIYSANIALMFSPLPTPSATRLLLINVDICDGEISTIKYTHSVSMYL